MLKLQSEQFMIEALEDRLADEILPTQRPLKVLTVDLVLRTVGLGILKTTFLVGTKNPNSIVCPLTRP